MSQALNCEVCCIGAGIAGLTAVNDLSESFILNTNKNKKDIILIESSSVLGGRIMAKKWNVLNTNNLNETKQIIIDVGAAYLHGIETNTNKEFIEFLHNECDIKFNKNTPSFSSYKIEDNLIHPLIKENCNIGIAPIYYEKHNKCYDLNQDDTPSFFENVDKIFENYMNNIEYDENNENKEDDANIIETRNGNKYYANKLPPDNLSFLEWLKWNKIDDEDSMNYAQLIYGTEQCIDIKDLGMRQFIKCCFEWNVGEGVIHLNGQYHKLIKYFKNKFENEYKNIVKILLNTSVNKIKYNNKNHVIISTNNGVKIKCKYCICTVPITVLKSNKIIFEPKLQVSAQKCISKIHAGKGGKIYLQFNKKFWSENTSIIYVADSEFVSELIFNTHIVDDCEVYTVCCLSFSKQSEIFKKYSQQEIVTNITKLLFKIFDLKNRNDIKCLKSFIFDWNNVENTNCTYSSFYPNSEEYRDILLSAIDNKLFFAGEALVKGFPAIQDTMTTAKDVVMQIRYLSSDLDHIYF